MITAPVETYTDAELDTVRAFRENGGGVILRGGAVPDTVRTNLSAIAKALGSDLRLGGAITDAMSNLNDDPAVPVTSNFDTGFELFGTYTGETEYGSLGRSRRDGS